MNILVSLYRESALLSMPVSGTITRLPVEGVVSFARVDSIRNWPSSGYGPYLIDEGESPTNIQFETVSFTKEVTRLSEDLEERQRTLRDFRNSFGTPLSTQAVDDPFSQEIMWDATPRILQAEELLLSLLWDNNIGDLANNVPSHHFPALEDRITINPATLRFCSSLLSLATLDTENLAKMVLAKELRRREGVPPEEGLRKYHVLHPTALFQILTINDPILYGEQQVTSTVGEFEELYSDYERLATDYWESLKAKKLYMRQDIQALIAWFKIEQEEPHIAARGLDIPELRPVHDPWKDCDPLEKLRLGRQEWIATQQKIRENIEILEKIGLIGFEYNLQGWPGGLIGLPKDAQSFYVAQNAIRELGYYDVDESDYDDAAEIPGVTAAKAAIAAALVEGHRDSWNRIYEYIQMLLSLEMPSPLTVPAPSRIEAAIRFSKAIMPYVATYVVATQMEFAMPNVFGGTKFRLNAPATIDVVESSIFESALSGANITRRILKDPSALDARITDLQGLSTDVEAKALAMTFPKDYSLEKGLAKVRAMIGGYFHEAERIRGVVANVERINQITQLIKAMLVRLNSRAFGSGTIDIPLDQRVVSVFASIGEHLLEGQPVVSVQKRFSVKGRSFLNSDQVAELNIRQWSAWKVKVKGVSEPAAGIILACLIRTIEPLESDLWGIDLDIFAAVTDRPAGVINLPKVLPLSTRYMAPALVGLTPDVLARVDDFFKQFSQESVEFLEQLH